MIRQSSNVFSMASLLNTLSYKIHCHCLLHTIYCNPSDTIQLSVGRLLYAVLLTC